MRRVRVHRHHDLGLERRRAAVDLSILALDQLDRDLRLRLAVLVLDDRVRPLELRTELVVVGELLEQPADVRVNLIGVLEIRQLAVSSQTEPESLGTRERRPDHPVPGAVRSRRRWAISTFAEAVTR